MVNWKQVVDDTVGIIRSFLDRGVTPTLRTVFYALVSKNAIPNTISAYKRLSSVLVKARKNNKIEWEWIADETRETRGGDHTYYEPGAFAKSYVDYIINAYQHYNYPKWMNQPVYIECWIEKFALAGTFNNWLSELNVVLVPSKGYSSWTFLKKAFDRIADATEEQHQKVILLYFGDFDPSGVDIERFLTDAMFWFGIDVEVKRIAITKDQVTQYNLPSVPEDASEIAKLQRDPRYKTWEHGLFRVELDALLAFVPDEFERIIKGSVQQYFDEDIYETVQEEERQAKLKVKETIMKLLREELGKTEDSNSEE